ncbi:UrcA family protein [Novosphingobium sp. PhB165]|uniref:UrcA family protein n=1 Tax=Novosphingobium sp. PhB165 TaxID=2485105 RepID=UPI0010433171|nr:UrcA family protein [Novosphingobium sp. PhB165]TCM19601.1 UrcA family protein [Novosphingobium sp. PhB165]
MTHFNSRKTSQFVPTRTLWSGVALLCTALPIASPALAQTVAATMTDGDRPTELVRYADLDLTSPQGRARLDARINSAIDHVCGRADIGDLEGRAQIHDCRSESAQRAYTARDTMLAARDRGDHVAALAISKGPATGRSDH